MGCKVDESFGMHVYTQQFCHISAAFSQSQCPRAQIRVRLTAPFCIVLFAIVFPRRAMSRKSMKVAAVPEEALQLLRSLSEQGVLQEALRQIMAPSGGSSMSDASKRRGDDLTEQEEFQLIADETGGSDLNHQVNGVEVIIRGVKAPEGIPDIHTWSRTVCTLPKMEKRNLSYKEMVEEAKTSTEMLTYLRWVRKNPQISAKVKDLSDYLKAAGERMTDEQSAVPSSGYYPGSTEARKLK